MYTIEIDFNVFKKLTAMRETETMTYNDVLRKMLGLGPLAMAAPRAEPPEGKPWVVKGVVFPHGTEFRANRKGQVYQGRVENGALVVNGKRFTSPSAAAMSITGSPINGWIFWECRRPGETAWQIIKNLRKS